VVHGALEQPHLTPGDIAVIAGPGAIGLLTLQVVRAAGARAVVIGTGADAHRLSLATELGAEHALAVGRDDLPALIRELTDGVGADIVYECSGAGPAARDLLALVRRGGQYAQIGLFGKPVALDLDQVCYKELRVTGSNASVPSAWARAVQLLDTGAVRTAPLVTGVYPVTEWRPAFEAFEAKSGLKTVLEPVN
jgi:L-iditol 2-dehydrogenase